MGRDVKTAAIQVLQQVGTALHTREITERIVAAGLWQSDGKNPDAIVSARLYSDVKSNGDKSPFAKVGPQTFALQNSAEMPCGAGPVTLLNHFVRKYDNAYLRQQVYLQPHPRELKLLNHV